MQRDGSTAWTQAVRRCPKTMLHGPCAGVTARGSCEVPQAGRCAFVDLEPGDWPYAPVTATTVATPIRRASTSPVVIADVPAAALDANSLRTVGGILGGSVDGGLTGDHGLARVQFPPSYRVRVLTDAGLATWAGLNCRDRNRVALEGEIAACVDAGAVGLHCVTGDHPAGGGRADAQAVFDLDALGLVRLAARRGVVVSVAHAPVTEPSSIRLPRLLAKASAGADTVFVDHCGGAAQVAAATTALRDAGFGGVVIACVPVVTDAESAQVLRSFAAGRVPSGYVESVLDATDRAAAGVSAAVELCREMLALPGVDGVDLSGGTRAGHELASAEALAEIGRLVRTPVRELTA